MPQIDKLAIIYQIWSGIIIFFLMYILFDNYFFFYFFLPLRYKIELINFYNEKTFDNNNELYLPNILYSDINYYLLTYYTHIFSKNYNMFYIYINWFIKKLKNV
jgi:hypothetical protein